jgi:twinkle protein
MNSTKKATGAKAISEMHLAWLETRGIEAATAADTGLFSGRWQGTGIFKETENGPKETFEVVPDANGKVLVFPVIDRGAVVAEKYREKGKKFTQRAKPKPAFFNSADLEHPDVLSGAKPLTIVEGEIDCLTLKQLGWPCVSVPNGANLPGVDENGNEVVVPDTADDIDVENDKAFKFVSASWDRLANVKRIVIMTDNDAPGRRLGAELVRRLGRVRCGFVAWPKDVWAKDGKTGEMRLAKDANEVFEKRGWEGIDAMLKVARPYPISGVYTLDEMPDEEPPECVSSGWKEMDAHFKPYLGALVIVTGLAGAGKSAWTTQFVSQLALEQGWKIGVFSREMSMHILKGIIGSTALGEPRARWNDEMKQMAWDFTRDHFVFVAPSDDADEEADFDWLLSRLDVAVIRHGIKVALVDPWNEIEHRKSAKETMTEYANRAILALKKWGRRMNVMVILVGHPTKAGAEKAPEDITLYDMADTAAFQNKADFGIIITRLGDVTVDKVSGVFVKKIRDQENCGVPGVVEFDFDTECRTFSVSRTQQFAGAIKAKKDKPKWTKTSDGRWIPQRGGK